LSMTFTSCLVGDDENGARSAPTTLAQAARRGQGGLAPGSPGPGNH
jgi:hypothetical protein